MQAEGRKNVFHDVDPGVTSIHTYPRFAIGQRTVLVQTAGGNFLWDMISYIDDETVAAIGELGGVQGIAVSHPHFYGVVVEYSKTFGAPIYIPAADREWFVRPDPAVEWFEGTVSPWDGVTVVQVGGHFEGSTVLHWRDGAEGQGALFTGDSISVAADSRWVTFMRSYPNYIPLPRDAIDGVVSAIEPFAFSRIYGGWLGNDVRSDAREAVRRSAERYIRWISGGGG
jgi:glyoxylase-like metal-dependent hydrolase (beta-lactamase superfamily II)